MIFFFKNLNARFIICTTFVTFISCKSVMETSADYTISGVKTSSSLEKQILPEVPGMITALLTIMESNGGT